MVYLYSCSGYIPPERFFEKFGNYHQRSAAGWKEWDATESAQMWYNGTIDNEGMVLSFRIDLTITKSCGKYNKVFDIYKTF